MLVIVVI